MCLQATVWLTLGWWLLNSSLMCMARTHFSASRPVFDLLSTSAALGRCRAALQQDAAATEREPPGAVPPPPRERASRLNPLIRLRAHHGRLRSSAHEHPTGVGLGGV
jgi:hypothetical protein